MGYPVPLTGLVILPVQMYKSYCTTVGLGGGGVGFSKIIKFYIKSFCLIGKVLSTSYPVCGQVFINCIFSLCCNTNSLFMLCSNFEQNLTE